MSSVTGTTGGQSGGGAEAGPRPSVPAPIREFNGRTGRPDALYMKYNARRPIRVLFVLNGCTIQRRTYCVNSSIPYASAVQSPCAKYKYKRRLHYAPEESHPVQEASDLANRVRCGIPGRPSRKAREFQRTDEILARIGQRPLQGPVPNDS